MKIYVHNKNMKFSIQPVERLRSRITDLLHGSLWVNNELRFSSHTLLYINQFFKHLSVRKILKDIIDKYCKAAESVEFLGNNFQTN